MGFKVGVEDMGRGGGWGGGSGIGGRGDGNSIVFTRHSIHHTVGGRLEVGVGFWGLGLG